MNEKNIYRADKCFNTTENQGDLCCYSCDVKHCDRKCKIEFEYCSAAFKKKPDTKEHELKILPEYYEAVLSGKKKFEIRKNDRNFKEGDMVKLREFKDGEYTGNFIKGRITYILFGGKFGLEEGYCIFSLSIYAHGRE